MLAGGSPASASIRVSFRESLTTMYLDINSFPGSPQPKSSGVGLPRSMRVARPMVATAAGGRRIDSRSEGERARDGPGKASPT